LLLVAEGEYEGSFGRMRIHAERCGFLRISEGTCWPPTRGVLNDALPNHITLFDLAVDPPALWDEQRERINSSRYRGA
jgi:hypothetical protein